MAYPSILAKGEHCWPNWHLRATSTYQSFTTELCQKHLLRNTTQSNNADASLKAIFSRLKFTIYWWNRNLNSVVITDKPKRQERQKYANCVIRIDVYVHLSHLKGSGQIYSPSFRLLFTSFELLFITYIWITNHYKLVYYNFDVKNLLH